MNKKEFDKRISSAVDHVLDIDDPSPGVCYAIWYAFDRGHAQKELFECIFRPQSPYSTECWWLGEAYEVEIQNIRLEFLYRFWDYCVERRLYLKW